MDGMSVDELLPFLRDTQRTQVSSQAFLSFFVPNSEKYYSFLIDNIPKRGYNVLGSEGYFLCI